MKKWYSSKTMWFNMLSISSVVVQYCTDTHTISLELQALTISIINILLRMITSKPIE